MTTFAHLKIASVITSKPRAFAAAVISAFNWQLQLPYKNFFNNNFAKSHGRS